MNWVILKKTNLNRSVWLEEIYRVIAKFFGIKPSQISIKRTIWNKPYLGMKGFTKAYFNYAHTKNYLLVGFSNNFEIGVDIEEINDGHKSIELITECLADEEKLYIKELEKEQKREALLKIWVQKEAIGKALGVGLLYDLSSITVKYNYAIHKEGFDISFWGGKTEGIVWREEKFWACVASIDGGKINES